MCMFTYMIYMFTFMFTIYHFKAIFLYLNMCILGGVFVANVCNNHVFHLSLYTDLLSTNDDDTQA